MNSHAFGIKSAKLRIHLLLVACLALGLLLPAFPIGFLSDDFNWLQLVRDTQESSWPQYLLIPSPFGYFRPLPMILFRCIGLSFPNSVWPFRLAILCCHLMVCLFVYILGRRLGYRPAVCLLAATIFAILPCHAESIFWIASLNELLASLFLLSGFLILLGNRSWRSDAGATLLFTLAIFSRESALCYLPLVLLLSLREPALRRPGLIPILLLSGLSFLGARLWWLRQLPAAVPLSSPGQLDLNPLNLAHRLLHYLTAMSLPVKPVFELLGFNHYEALRLWVLSSPGAKPILGLIAILTLGALAVSLIKLPPGRQVWPGLIFALIALSVYLPFGQTSEHFLYLPSVGFAYALASLLIVAAERWRSAGTILTAVILSIYLFGSGSRLYRWRQASRISEENLSHLESMIADIPAGSRVLITGLNNRYFGLPFLGEHCLNEAWAYRFPAKRIHFYFDPTRHDPYQVVYSPIEHRFFRRR